MDSEALDAAEPEAEPSDAASEVQQDPEGHFLRSASETSEDGLLIVFSFQSLFVYYFHTLLQRENVSHHLTRLGDSFARANVGTEEEVVIFWRSYAKELLEWILCESYPCQLGIISGSMEDEDLLEVINQIMTTFGWDTERIDSHSLLLKSSEKRIQPTCIHLFGRDCVEDRPGGSRKLLKEILAKCPEYNENTVLLVERKGTQLEDSELQNTLLIRPFIEDVYETWAWEVQDEELPALRRILDTILWRARNRPDFCLHDHLRPWKVHCVWKWVNAQRHLPLCLQVRGLTSSWNIWQHKRGQTTLRVFASQTVLTTLKTNKFETWARKEALRKKKSPATWYTKHVHFKCVCHVETSVRFGTSEFGTQPRQDTAFWKIFEDMFAIWALTLNEYSMLKEITSAPGSPRRLWAMFPQQLWGCSDST